MVKSKPTPPPLVPPPPAPTPPTYSDWGPVLWGSEFQATPGASLRYIKGTETKLSNGATSISYTLTVEGLPKDEVYYFWMKDGALPTEPKRYWQVEIDGTSVKMPTLIFGNFVKGEAFELALANNDKTIVALCKIIPAPIEVKQGSYRLWLELKSPDGKVFLAWGEGFEPNEEVDIVSTSDSEILSSKGKADADGRVMVALLPSVVGKTSGVASITLKGKAGEIKVSYEWGPPALISQ